MHNVELFVLFIIKIKVVYLSEYIPINSHIVTKPMN